MQFTVVGQVSLVWFVLVSLLVTVVDLLDSFKFAQRYRGGLKLDPVGTCVPGEKSEGVRTKTTKRGSAAKENHKEGRRVCFSEVEPPFPFSGGGASLCDFCPS